MAANVVDHGAKRIYVGVPPIAEIEVSNQHKGIATPAKRDVESLGSPQETDLPARVRTGHRIEDHVSLLALK